jgi:hypothetical protein
MPETPSQAFKLNIPSEQTKYARVVQRAKKKPKNHITEAVQSLFASHFCRQQNSSQVLPLTLPRVHASVCMCDWAGPYCWLCNTLSAFCLFCFPFAVLARQAHKKHDNTFVFARKNFVKYSCFIPFSIIF